jgi:hypothetical protein
LQHYSLIFTPRNNNAQLAIHERLCSKVLDIYLAIARQLGRQLTMETWEIFLKVVFGVGDALLTQPITGEDSLTKRLSSQVLKVSRCSFNEEKKERV